MLQAQSEFAKNKTLAQQRRFLPVYESREDLLHIIRENQVVVVVGETGSGKTTQVGPMGLLLPPHTPDVALHAAPLRPGPAYHRRSTHWNWQSRWGLLHVARLL